MRILAAALLARNLYLIFLQLPDEAAQGAIYRIIYFHVPSAITAMLGFMVAGAASGIYLGTKNLRYDAVAAAVYRGCSVRRVGQSSAEVLR